MPYFAHSGRNADKSDWQLLAEHLRGVADEAAKRAGGVGLPGLVELATSAGWLHDLGKYRPGFQEYIRNPTGPTPRGERLHKEAGAAKAVARKLVPVGFAVFGHHGGLPDRTDLEVGVRSPAGYVVAAEVWAAAVADCPLLAAPIPTPPRFDTSFRADLFTRVLFSCLVDADWVDTGEHDRRVKGWEKEPDAPALRPDDWLKLVEAHIAGKAAKCDAGVVKDARSAVLTACLSAADGSPKLYSLTVPTGGGKTLAGLAFALKHAAKNGLRRVIYVAPYMTILEQTIDVFRAALGLTADAPDLFEHYSLAEPPGGDGQDETRREAAARRAANWDAPVVVTTNVQFFESLFGNKPGRCRKLHNIARSVVILDECQTLPPGLVAPTCGMLNQLVADLGCTVVLCTATQPAFDHATLHADEKLKATPIIPETVDLFGPLKRVTVDWPKGDESLDWPDVAARMAKEASALSVVNTKKAARAVYDELTQLGLSGVFHLSTGMCPQHRREKLDVIRRRLKDGQPVYLVSTQMIEAGVDVDFPFLMRELAPLESVIQAAGRCNREGKQGTAGGRVEVFRSVDGKMPPDRWYNAGRDVLEGILKAKGGPQIDDPEAIRDYFRRLYYTGGAEGLDAEGIQVMRQKFQFQSVAERYRVIDNPGEPVVVATWDSYRAEIASLLDTLKDRPRKSAFRALAKFQVNLLPRKIADSAAFLHREPSNLLVWRGKYDEDAGIVDEMADDFVI